MGDVKMHKSSKKIKGPVTEDIPEAPTEQTEIMQEVEPAKVEPLEPEEVGIKIYVFMPKHSKSTRKLAAMQFKEGKVKEAGTILLPDGQTIQAGATVKTEMRPELNAMLRDGVFLAGKCPRRS